MINPIKAIIPFHNYLGKVSSRFTLAYKNCFVYLSADVTNAIRTILLRFFSAVIAGCICQQAFTQDTTNNLELLNGFHFRQARSEIKASFTSNLVGLKEFKTKLSPLSSKSAFDLRSASIVQSLNYGQTLNVDKTFFSRTEAVAALSIAGVPFNATYLDNSALDDMNFSINKWAVHYDRNDLLQDLYARVTPTINPQELLAGLADPLAALRSKLGNRLGTELNELNNRYRDLLKSTLVKLPGIDDLARMDLSAIRAQLLDPEVARSIGGKEELFARLIAAKNLGEAIDEKLFADLNTSIEAFKAGNEMIATIEQHKESWIKNGFVDKLREWEVFKSQELQKLLKEPSTILALAKKQISLSGLQRTLSKFSKLSLGNRAQTTSPLTFQAMLSKAPFAEFLNHDKYLSLLSGRFGDVNTIRDIGPVENLFAASGIARAVRVGNGSGQTSFSHLSLSSFDHFPGGMNIANPRTAWKTMVTTFSKQIVMGDKGLLFAEFSKSASTYNSGKGFQNPGENGILNQFLNQPFFGNLAIAARYEQDHYEKGLSYQVNFQKVAQAYDNPGNAFLSGGSTEFSIRGRKTLLEKRLSISVRATRRGYNYGTRWRYTYSSTEIRWKFKRGQYVQFRYSPSNMVRLAGVKQRVYETSRLGVDAAISTKFHSTLVRHQLHFYFQNNSQHLGSLNRSLGASVYETITIGRNVAFFSGNYNYSRNAGGFAFFNTSLMTEGGINYFLGKRITASSSFTYQWVASWYKRVSIRQSLSGSVRKRWGMNLYLDAGPTLGQTLYFRQSALQGQFSIQYFLQNQ